MFNPQGDYDMLSSIHAMVEPQRNGLLTSCYTSLREVAGVLGRVNMAVTREVADVVSFSDIFNCLSQMKHAIGETVTAEGYIPKEGLVDFRLQSQNSIGLSEFMRRAANGTVKGLPVSRCERESLMILASTLRLHHASNHPAAA